MIFASYKTIQLLTLMFLVSLGAAFAQPAPTPPGPSHDENQTGTISGAVVSAATGEPLRKAAVVLDIDHDSGNTRRVTATGADGKFIFEGVPAGTYKLIADRDGYVPKAYGEDSSGLALPFLTLVAGQDVGDVIFRLEKYAIVSGRVVDEDGDPVRDVPVQVIRRATRKGKSTIRESLGERHTNELGEYRLFDLMPGHYYIRVKPSPEQKDYLTAIRPPSQADEAHPRTYVTTYYPGVADSSRATEIDLKSGDEISAIDITLSRSRTYVIRGRVIDESGLSVGGHHTIKVLPEAEPESMGFKEWEDTKDGSFEIDGLVLGKYMLAASGLEENVEAVSGFARVTVTEASCINFRFQL